MSHCLKDVQYLYTDQHDTNLISTVVNSSDDAELKTHRAGDNSSDHPVKRVSENPETSTSKPSEAMEVPADTFATLIEQTTSLSISYTNRLKILKKLLKAAHKAKTLLKEKTATFQESVSHLFGKKFRSHIIEIERSKKQSLEFLRVIMTKTLPFEKALHLTKIDCKMEGNTVTRQNQAIQAKAKIFDFKTTQVQVLESSIVLVYHQMVNTSFDIQKEVPVSSNSDQVPLIKILDIR